MKITIIAFNFGNSSKFTNGPGMSLYSFVNSIRSEYSIDLFLSMPTDISIRGVNIRSMDDSIAFRTSLASSVALHHWSGIDNRFVRACKVANNADLPVIIGPNVLDLVKREQEENLLKVVEPSAVLTTNERLKYKLAKEHQLDIDLFRTLIVGPDLKKWKPLNRVSDKVLWKGNSKHKVKDIDFALELKESLPQYNFKILGHPNPYDYEGHIKEAKDARVYVNTSLSETKSMTTIESWAAGIPSVTHPRVYLHGQNYKTGIIASRNIDDYREAIIEIMEDDALHGELRRGARQYCVDHFSSEVTLKEYDEIVANIIA
jgi:glycosyltransferase involved in cell wall biosynthesis